MKTASHRGVFAKLAITLGALAWSCAPNQKQIYLSTASDAGVSENAFDFEVLARNLGNKETRNRLRKGQSIVTPNGIITRDFAYMDGGKYVFIFQFSWAPTAADRFTSGLLAVLSSISVSYGYSKSNIASSSIESSAVSPPTRFLAPGTRVFSGASYRNSQQFSRVLTSKDVVVEFNQSDSPLVIYNLMMASEKRDWQPSLAILNKETGELIWPFSGSEVATSTDPSGDHIPSQSERMDAAKRMAEKYNNRIMTPAERDEALRKIREEFMRRRQ